MKYRKLGKSGLKVSELSFGSWVTFHNQVDLDLAKSMIKTSYDSGINFFDNAEAYAQGNSELIMGQAIDELGFSRDSYCVSSKVFWGGSLPTQRGLSRKHLIDACNAALKRLRVDYLDLYFCHRPDPSTPIEETVRTMNDLIRQGKILYWGTSEWSAEQLTKAYLIADKLGLEGPSMEQPEYNLFHRERFEKEYANLYSEFGLGTTIWSPLASGILTGKYRNGIPENSRVTLKGYEWLRKSLESEKGQKKIADAVKLEDLAKELDMSLTVFSLAWCLKNPNVSTVILGASKESQLAENLKASEAAEKIDDSVLARTDEILGNKPKPDFDWLKA